MGRDHHEQVEYNMCGVHAAGLAYTSTSLASGGKPPQLVHFQLCCVLVGFLTIIL